MMLFFPTSCLSNEVLIRGLQLSNQQGEDEVRRSWGKWRAREQCRGNNAHLCSSGLLGNRGCIQLPGKITCPKTLGCDAQRKEAPCSKEGSECYPRESSPPPVCPKCLPLVPVQAVEKGNKARLGWPHLLSRGDGSPSSAGRETPRERDSQHRCLVSCLKLRAVKPGLAKLLPPSTLLGKSSMRRAPRRLHRGQVFLVYCKQLLPL